jgi:hypothetical protein
MSSFRTEDECLYTFFHARICVAGGKLIFDEKNVELQSEIILITDGGLLQVKYSHSVKQLQMF